MERTRHLGRTGLRVTRLGLGLAALGRPGYITLGRSEDLQDRSVEALQARSGEVLDAAYDAGVRVFDVARSYGRAEAFLRAWIDRRDLDPGAAMISSKWGYTYTADWQIDAPKHEVKDHSLQQLLRQWELSKQQLWDYLDLYQVHSATLDSGVLDNLEVLNGLARIKNVHGVSIGLSLSGPRQSETLRRAIDVSIDGEQLFDTVQATWNVLEPSAGEALLEAREWGLGVIVKESLANGRLTDRGSDSLAPATRDVIETASARHGVDVATWSIAAALAQPWADVVLSGAVTVDQLHNNLAAEHVEWTAEDDAALAKASDPAETYWSFRKTLPWA